MVTYGDAKMAMLDVIKQVGSHVSEEVKGHLIRRMTGAMHSKGFFTVLDQNDWIKYVTAAYNLYFKKVIGEGLLEGVKQGCHGFTTPNDHSKRQLFVAASANYGTVVHEFVHWLQHTNAYPKFYEEDKDGSFFLEGVTEYFTREAYSGQDRVGHYEKQLKAVKFGLAAKDVTEKELATFAFGGGAFPEALRSHKK